MDKVRVDKWLWAARFFKTRALAVKACELGRVKLQDHAVKPARDVRAGDQLSITNEGGTFGVEVLQLSDVRGPAAVAQNLYRETEASTAARKVAEEAKRSLSWVDQVTSGKPDKRGRRDLHKFRGY